MPRNRAGKPIDPTDWNRNDGFSPGRADRDPRARPGQARRRSTGHGAVPIDDMRRAFDKKQPVVVINARTRSAT